MESAYTYAEAKAAMKAKGYAVAEGDEWAPADNGHFLSFVASEGRLTNRTGSRVGDPYSLKDAFKGFSSPTVPEWLLTLIKGGDEVPGADDTESENEPDPIAPQPEPEVEPEPEAEPAQEEQAQEEPGQEPEQEQKQEPEHAADESTADSAGE